MAAAKNRYLSDDHEDFTVSDRDALISVLQGLARKNVVLSGAFNSGADLLLTAVLDVDPKENVVYLDVNANEERNQLFLQSKRVIFFSFFDGVKVQWASTAIESGEYEGRKAFLISIPEKLQRVQRRGAFRINTPITNPAICTIPLASGEEVTLPLVDICVEGIGVILPSTPVPEIQKYAEFKKCRIEHEDLGVVEATLVVQSIWEVTLKNGSKSPRAGLEFVDIRAGTQSVIQRYVYKLERIVIATSKEK